MATRKDMRRPDLIIPFVEPEPEKSDQDMAGTIGQTIPMAAIFMRNKMIGWVSVVFSLQNWLAEPSEQRKASSMPGYFNVFMSLTALGTTYLPLFMPPQAPSRGTGTEAQAPLPLSHA